MKMAKFGVFATPAVLIDGDIKCEWKVPGKEEIKKWITR